MSQRPRDGISLPDSGNHASAARLGPRRRVDGRARILEGLRRLRLRASRRDLLRGLEERSTGVVRAARNRGAREAALRVASRDLLRRRRPPAADPKRSRVQRALWRSALPVHQGYQGRRRRARGCLLPQAVVAGDSRLRSRTDWRRGALGGRIVSAGGELLGVDTAWRRFQAASGARSPGWLETRLRGIESRADGVNLAPGCVQLA